MELTLSKYGVTRNDLGKMADEAIQIKRLFDNNPVPLKKDDLITIYSKLI